MKIVLASSSPRRKEILSRLNIPFTIDCKNIIEPKYNPLNISPVNYCKKLSRIKAESISLKYNNTLIIGADTIVLLNKNVLGKPSDKEEAFKTLIHLSGKTHKVITGVTIIYNNIIHTFSETSTVKFFKLDKSEILKYINTDCPYDKAGSYGIQDYSTIFVEKINGSYDNIVGFPLSRFNNELKKINLTL